jgi:DNA-binding XRE family transcriptional regulator
MTGTGLQQFRRKLGLSQAALGKKLNLTREMIGLMERGHKAISTRTELSVWCLLYEADMAEIGDRANQQHQPTTEQA